MSIDLECYGMPAVKTPVLNNLAATGIQYMNAYGNNSICSPSRSNMITGVHQNIINAQHHRSNRNIPLAAPYKPITSYLRDAGYTCIIGNNIAKGKGRKIDVNFKHKSIGAWDGEKEFGLFDKAGDFTAEDQPFFSQVTLTVTHRGDWWNDIREKSTHKVNPNDVVLPPHYADNPVIREDWAKYLDQVEYMDNEAHKVNPNDVVLPPHYADNPVIREDWAKYFDQVEYMDNEVGLLLADLEKKGMRDNTIVIFIGDNGRCNVRGKGYMYEPGLHLPLIVNWPAGITGGKKDTRLVASVDVAATILEAAGVELPAYMTARSIIEEDPKPRTYIYSARDLWDEILEQSRAITTHKYRYIKNNITNQSHDAHQAYLEFHRPAVHVMRNLKENGALTEVQERFFADSKEPEELFDIVNDPFELNNLINNPDYQDVANEMKAHFDDWNAKNHDYGFDPINWKNCPPPKANAIIKWLEKEKPEIIEQMQQGIEPGFGKISKEFKEKNKK